MQTDECSEPPKIDPRVRRTRKLIEDAFRALLLERPFSEITVADVTARATVNRATFYAHFASKEQLATALMGGDLETALRAQLTHGIPLKEETLGKVAEAIYDFFGRRMSECDALENPDSHDRALTPTLMATFQETIQSLVRRWLDLDEDAMNAFPGARKDDVATVLAWGLYGGALRWSRIKRRSPAAEAARRIVALLIGNRQ